MNFLYDVVLHGVTRGTPIERCRYAFIIPVFFSRFILIPFGSDKGNHARYESRL